MRPPVHRMFRNDYRAASQLAVEKKVLVLHWRAKSYAGAPEGLSIPEALQCCRGINIFNMDSRDAGCMLSDSLSSVWWPRAALLVVSLVGSQRTTRLPGA